MTQSAGHRKALQEVEALQISCFLNRTYRGAVPSLAGENTNRPCAARFDQLRHAEEHLADLRDGNRGRVAVGTLLSAAATLFAGRDCSGCARSEGKHRHQNRRGGTNDVLMPRLRAGRTGFLSSVRLSEHRENNMMSNRRSC